MTSKIIIKQQGTIPVWQWMSHDECEFRSGIPGIIVDALQQDLLKSKGPYELTYINRQSGEEAVVCKVELCDGKAYALKIVRTVGVVSSEANFLNAWNDQGVQVPHIHNVYKFNDKIDILVMDYIDAPLLSEQYSSDERVRLGLSFEMGKILAQMHGVKGEGFGRPDNVNCFRGRFTSFAEEMNYEFNKRLPFLIDQGLVNSNCEKKVESSIEILNKEFQSKPPSLTHCDFRPRNIFYTQHNGLIVFDPNCRITVPTMCLALSLIRLACEGDTANPEESRKFLEGYTETLPIDQDMLRASILLRALLVLSTWVKKSKINDTSRLLAWLTNNKVMM